MARNFSLFLFLVSLSVTLCAAQGNFFRVTPYLQRPSTDGMTIMWLMQEDAPGRVQWWDASRADAKVFSGKSSSRLAPEFSYDPSQTNYAKPYLPFTVPYQHRIRIEGLSPATRYCYRVECGGVVYSNFFRTAPLSDSPIRFICYADSETEPESTGSRVAWDDPKDEKASRRYLIDQTTGYASNIVHMIRRNPDLILISGDLAEMGSKQVDWDEFWRHNAGAYNDPAGSIPILASPGNHDYHSYRADSGEVAMRKYLSYFEFNPNGAPVEADRQERFHRLDYGPATFIFLDLNNGRDDDPSKDTNQALSEKTCRAPDFNEGSAQWNWLEAQLKDAQERSRFIFVISHQCPYSVGPHGRPNGDKGREQYGEWLSGVPTRVLTPLLMRYGVTAWICGHDEIVEHSVVKGKAIDANGKSRKHKLHVYDVGFSGDGLRGRRRTSKKNPYEVFRVHVDSKEIWKDGRLIDGGKHYGHLEVNIAPNEKGKWEAILTPVYIFVGHDEKGQPSKFERRVYDDVTVIQEQ